MLTIKVEHEYNLQCNKLNIENVLFETYAICPESNLFYRLREHTFNLKAVGWGLTLVPFNLKAVGWGLTLVFSDSKYLGLVTT